MFRVDPVSAIEVPNRGGGPSNRQNLPADLALSSVL